MTKPTNRFLLYYILSNIFVLQSEGWKSHNFINVSSYNNNKRSSRRRTKTFEGRHHHHRTVETFNEKRTTLCFQQHVNIQNQRRKNNNYDNFSIPLSTIIYQNNRNNILKNTNPTYIVSKSSSSSSLQMALLPIPVSTLDKILTSRLPTPAQYASYWGRTSREQYNAGFEAFGVAFLGVFTSYFLSFAIGQFIATILGMIAASWFLLGPELKAYQRNWELTGGRELVDPWIDDYYDNNNDDDELDDYYYDDDEDKRGLYGAFYLGRIEHVCVVDYPSDPPEDEYSLEEFEGYTMEKDEQEREIGIPYSLRLRVSDSTDDGEGRELQVHARMSEEYLDLEVGMPICTVLLSTSQKFQTLSAMTDFCVPDAGPCWVGDYPYLDRPALEELLVRDDELWDYLREEGRGDWDVMNSDDDDD